MEPFKRLAAKSCWYDREAVGRFWLAKDLLWRKYLSNATVLEIGCGPGTGALETSNCGARAYVGLDSSIGMACDARRAYPQFSFIAARAEALPFADGQYDVVLTCFTMHHLPLSIRPGVLGEMARVSKGILLVQDVYGFPKRMKRLLYEAYYRIADGSHYRYTLKEWEEFFRHANLRIVEHADCGESTIAYRCGAWVLQHCASRLSD
jgi:ubiquinone/menaquinone biosynthesis C-methylase UbiE